MPPCLFVKQKFPHQNESLDLAVGCLVRFVLSAGLAHQNNEPDATNERDKGNKNPRPSFAYITKVTNHDREIGECACQYINKY